MWWNPINSIRHQLNPKPVPISKPLLSTTTSNTKKTKLKSKTTSSTTNCNDKLIKKRKNSVSSNKQRKELCLDVLKEDPSHCAYWAQGTGGKGAVEAWKFNCICGEICSSYENYRYHPVGAMYACTTCGIWSHVVCMLGTNFSLEDLEEMEAVYCKKCISKVRREKIRELREMNIVWENDELRNIENEDNQGEDIENSNITQNEIS